MAGGQSSNLVGASSSSTPARKPKGTKRSRQQNDTHGEEAKKQQQRHPHLRVATAHPNAAAAAAVPVVPLHYAPASNAMPVAALPMAAAGVNGAALRWTTAAAGSKAPVWSLPVVAGPTAAGQVVSVPLPLISYEPAAMAGSPAAPPLPPLVDVLENIRSDTLGRLLTAVMRSCDPPMLQPQSWGAAAGAPPPWWPAAADTDPENTPVPFAPPYKLRKEEKVAVLVAIVKHHAPDLEVFASDALCEKAKLSNDPEAAKWWKRALAIEAARHNNPIPNAPVVNLIMAPHAGAGHLPAASGGVVGADVATPAADDGGHGLQVVGGGKPEQKQEQPGDGVLRGGAMAADAGFEKPVNFLGDEFAAADMDQLLDDMLAPLHIQQLEQAQQAIDAEAAAAVEAAVPEERRWYMNDDNTSFFDDFEPLKDENGKIYLDYLGDLW